MTIVVLLTHAISNIIFVLPAIACGFYLFMLVLKINVLNKRNAYVINGIHKHISSNNELTETEYEPSKLVRYILVIQTLSWYILLASMFLTIGAGIEFWMSGITVAISGFLYTIFVVMFSSFFEHLDSKFGHGEFYI